MTERTRQAHLAQLPLQLRFLLQQALQRRRSFPGHAFDLKKKRIHGGNPDNDLLTAAGGGAHI